MAFGSFAAEPFIVDKSVDRFQLRAQLLRQAEVFVPTLHFRPHFENDDEHLDLLHVRLYRRRRRPSAPEWQSVRRLALVSTITEGRPGVWSIGSTALEATGDGQVSRGFGHGYEID